MEGVSSVNSSGNSNASYDNLNNNSSSGSKIVFHDSLQSLKSSGSGHLSLLAFMNLVGSTSNDLQETLKISTQSTLVSRIPFYLNSIGENSSAASQYASFLIYYGQATVIGANNDASVTSLSTSLNDYNSKVSADLAAVNTMNTAIAQYQNGDIDQATYNAAVATYNAYATLQAARAVAANTAISGFNTGAATTNASIDILNDNIPPSGIALTHQSTYTARPGMPLIAAAPPQPTTGITFSGTVLHPSNTITPSTFTLSLLVFNATTTFIVNVANDALLMLMLKNADRYFVSKLLFLAGKNITLPEAYTLPANKISVTNPGTAGGAGSSVNLSTAGTSLSNSNVNDVLGHSIFISDLEEIYTKQFTSLDQDAADKFSLSLDISASNLVSQMGLFSISTAIRLLGGNGALASIDPRSSIAAVALSLGLISELKGAVAGGVFISTILELLKTQNPTLPEDQIQALASVLSAAIELKVLLLGVLNLSANLESPKLTGQLLGTVTETGSKTSLSEILKDSNNLQTLSLIFANEANLSADDASNIVNDSIVKGDITAANLRSDLSAALIKKGLSDDAANLTASNTLNNFNLEISAKHFQDLQITKGSIVGTPLDSKGVNALLEANNGSLSGALLQAKMAAEFAATGLSENEANSTARDLIASLDGTFPIISQEELASELNAQVIQKSAGNIDSTVSKSLAAELESILFDGNDSVAKLLKSRIDTIKKYSNAEVNARLEEVFKKFTTPDVITLGLAILLGDPATALLYMASGLIYTPDESPSAPGSVNREKLASIDMPI